VSSSDDPSFPGFGAPGLEADASLSNVSLEICEEIPPPEPEEDGIIQVRSANPSSGVAISAQGGDATSGSTAYNIVKKGDLSGTLRAPATAAGNDFASWQGCDLVSGRTCSISVAEGTTDTVTATYSTPPAEPEDATLQVRSSNPAFGVSISAQGGDVTGGATAYNIVQTGGLSGTLRAPSVASGNDFASWQGCDSVSGRDCSISVSEGATDAVTVSYTTPPPPGDATLQVNSFNPSSGASIAALSGNLTSGSTAYNRRLY
jgi:hypothetical protein